MSNQEFPSIVSSLAVTGILEAVREGTLSPADAEHQLRRAMAASATENLGFARVDHARADRQGFPEVVFGPGKTPEQIARIADAIVARGHSLLVTRTTGAAFDVVAILKKGRHAVTGCEVNLTAERADTDPKVFTHIHFHFRVTGKGLKPEVVTRAINLSKEKYCSASIMLGETAKITHDFEIVEAA